MCSCRIVFDKQHLNCKIGFLSSGKKAFHKDFWSINPFLGVWIDSLCAFFWFHQDANGNACKAKYEAATANGGGDVRSKVVIRNLVGRVSQVGSFGEYGWRNFPRNLTTLYNQIPMGFFGKCISFRLFCNFWIRVSMLNFWRGSLSELFHTTWQAYRNKTQECDMRQAHLGHCFLKLILSISRYLNGKNGSLVGQLCSK